MLERLRELFEAVRYWLALLVLVAGKQVGMLLPRIRASRAEER